MPSKKHPLVFISHSHNDHGIAEKIKTDLERLGIDAFIAHVDIVPSLEWRQEILKQLEACDLVIALLTSAFKDSKWTDQEAGIAIAKGKPILPIAIELMPYGFLEQFQALPWEATNSAQRRADLLRTLADRLGIPSEPVVRAFVKSASWEEAGIATRLIVDRTDLTNEQINRIARAWLENGQINGSFAARQGLHKFLEEHEDEIEPALRAKVSKLP